MTDTAPTRACRNCGKTFPIAARQHRRLYCSRTCWQRHRKGRPRDPALAAQASARWADPGFRERNAAALRRHGWKASAVPREVDARRILDLLGDRVNRTADDIRAELDLGAARFRNCIRWLEDRGVRLTRLRGYGTCLWGLPEELMPMTKLEAGTWNRG